MKQIYEEPVLDVRHFLLVEDLCAEPNPSENEDILDVTLPGGDSGEDEFP